jgi:nucleotide-binding universal stress UspA family protein
MRILVATDNSPGANNAAHFVVLLARPAGAQITLLGLEGPHPDPALHRRLDELAQALCEDSGCDTEIKLRHGDAEEQILVETQEHHYDLVVIGSQRPGGLRRLVSGATSGLARSLAQRLNTSLLVVSEDRRQIRRVLICTSGETSGERDARAGGLVAALVGAEVAVLHVMSQVALTPNARIDYLEQDADQLMASEAREGVHLRRVMDILEEVGIPAQRRRARVRHGLVLDEIKREVSQGDYDLLVIGAHQVPEDRSWRELRAMLLENLADEILEEIPRPVLVVRATGAGAWSIRPPAQAARPDPGA